MDNKERTDDLEKSFDLFIELIKSRTSILGIIGYFIWIVIGKFLFPMGTNDKVIGIILWTLNYLFLSGFMVLFTWNIIDRIIHKKADKTDMSFFNSYKKIFVIFTVCFIISLFLIFFIPEKI